jgi:hypothetical protein
VFALLIVSGTGAAQAAGPPAQTQSAVDQSLAAGTHHAGPDGNLWFTELYGRMIMKMSP